MNKRRNGRTREKNSNFKDVNIGVLCGSEIRKQQHEQEELEEHWQGNSRQLEGR
jgi:hypothetical protein